MSVSDEFLEQARNTLYTAAITNTPDEICLDDGH